MTIDEAMKIVASRQQGRTRWEGQEPYLDEVMFNEITRLRLENKRLLDTHRAFEDSRKIEW